MALNLLLAVKNTNPLDMPKWAAGLFTFVLGMIVVFLGIAIIVFFVEMTGKIMKGKDKKAEDKNEDANNNVQNVEVESVADDEIPEDVRVAIIAAIAAYYDGEQSQNSFTVRKIKKLR